MDKLIGGKTIKREVNTSTPEGIKIAKAVEGPLEVALILRPERKDGEKLFIRAYVTSVRRKGAKAFTDIEPKMHGNLAQLRHAVGIGSAAAAEHVNELYGDPIDPSDMYNEALKAWDQLLREFEAYSRS
jgi:hypothetical protein